MGAVTFRESSRDRLDTITTTNDFLTAFLPVSGPSLLKESSSDFWGFEYLSFYPTLNAGASQSCEQAHSVPVSVKCVTVTQLGAQARHLGISLNFSFSWSFMSFYQ